MRGLMDVQTNMGPLITTGTGNGEIAMKIDRVEIIPVNIPYKVPFRVSYGGITSGSYIILRILTDDGVDGVGSSIGFGKIGLTRESAMAQMKSIASGLLLGQDSLNTEAILSRLDAVVPGNWRIKAHFDYALYDLKGKGVEGRQRGLR